MSSCVTDKLCDLGRLKSHYENYMNSEYLFKKCNRRYLVILKKVPTTLTNESRKYVVDPQSAKFRANHLEVVKIIDLRIDPYNSDIIELEKITSVFHNSALITKINKGWVDRKSLKPEQKLKVTTEYIVGQIVYADHWTNEINKICDHGIHYFKSLEPAYYYSIYPYHPFGYKYCDSGVKQY